jgi:hypothetical protein
MLYSKNSRPKWWQLYLTFPLLIVLFVLDARIKLSARGHQVVQIAIVLLVFWLIHLWMKANSLALSRMDHEQYYGDITAFQILPYQVSDSEEEKHSTLAPLVSEIKGVLSDTFEMDYIDAEALPIDEVSQEWKKE